MIGITVVAFFLCAVNIILWLVFLKKFKELFSTDDIITSTREELNRMIEDVNRNTSRDIRLIDSRIKELKAVSADADRHIAVAKNELEKQANSSAYQHMISEMSGSSKKRQTPAQKAAASYRNNAAAGLASQMSYSVTEEGRMQLPGTQGELFTEEQSTIEKEIVNSSGTRFSVESSGASVASVPVIGPEVSFAENPVKPKKDFNEMVLELSEKGESVESIAKLLGCSTTEVQFVIDMDS